MESEWDRVLKLVEDRKRDRRQAKTRRRRQAEAAPEHFEVSLASFFRKDPMALQRIEESKAISAWAGFVGPVAARVSTAEKIRNNQLVVSVADPLWLQQLTLLKSELLRKYRKAFPSLRLQNIYFHRATPKPIKKPRNYDNSLER